MNDIREMIAELQRERAMRDRVYPDLIRRGKLSFGQAHRQNRILDDVIEYLRGEEEGGR